MLLITNNIMLPCYVCVEFATVADIITRHRRLVAVAEMLLDSICWIGHGVARWSSAAE